MHTRESFYRDISVNKQQLSYLFVILDSEKSGNHYKFIKNIKNKLRVIGVCGNLWKYLSQRNAHGTTGNKNNRT